MKTKLLIICLLLFTSQVYALDECKGGYGMHWDNCHGTYIFPNIGKYVGEYKNGKKHGQGTLTFLDGKKYEGKWKDGNFNGQGVYTYFYNGKFVGKFIGEFRDNKTYRGKIINANGKEININSKTPKIIGIWRIMHNTGGIGVFDRATFKRLIIFQDKNLYKTIVIGYDWGDYNTIEIIRDDQGNEIEHHYDWIDRIGFIPTKYFENKISDFDSTEHFIGNMTNKFCDDNEYDECINMFIDENPHFLLHTLTQNEIINCLQKNKNEVLSEEQTNYDEDNYANSRIPKIWDCIHSYSSKKPFDKRK